MSQRTRSTPLRRAFTLIEVIVVIGIVLLLTALTVAVATGVLTKSEVRSTENTLRLLDLALSEWQGEADRMMTWGVDDEPVAGRSFDFQPGTPQVSNADDETMLQIVLEELRSSPASNDILRQIDPEFMRTVDVDGEEQLEVLDAWEQPLYVIHPGRVAEPRTYTGFGNPLNSDVGVFIDDDGTIRVGHPAQNPQRFHFLITSSGPDTGWENLLGVCQSRRICFVSAGPDGEFGNLSAAADSTDYQATLDNVYSYPVGTP